MPEELIGPAPTGWCYGNLSDLQESKGIQGGPFGSQLHAEDYVPSGVPLIMPKNIGENRLLETGHDFITENDAERLSTHRVITGDIVVGRKGDLSRRALIREAQQGWLCGTDCIRIRVDRNTVSPRYLSYYMGLKAVADWLHRHDSGSTMPSLNTRNLGRLPVLLAPRSYQTAIAAMLSALDDKIAVNERIIATSHELMRMKYAESLQPGVKKASIGDIADVFDGPHATPKKTESGPWFLSISSLSRGRLRFEESAHLEEEDFERWTRRVTPTAGDVLFSYETRLGEAALMPPDVRACLGRRMALLRPHSVGSRTLLQAFLSQSFQETIRRYSVHGATVDRIPLTEFPAWQIELPAEELEILESVLSGLDELAACHERENETLAELRDTLLPKLMSGELRVRDAEKVVEDVVL